MGETVLGSEKPKCRQASTKSYSSVRVIIEGTQEFKGEPTVLAIPLPHSKTILTYLVEKVHNTVT